jgi:uncharacterized protein (TIGR00159 family)
LEGVLLVNGDLLGDLGQFVTDLLQDLTSGLIFFGGPLDIFLAVLDVLATSLVVYYVLKILRDSRAWQLLKGLALIISFALICSLIGLDTVGFLLNNTISVLAIAFVVIFQPELRRALETVGRNSFNMISSAVVSDDGKNISAGSVHNMIESIVRACERMSETFTGALIIIERTTKLGDFIEQENVVQLDAAVSATFIQQIFYKGSPLHDGAILIRGGRVSAARVHVPLSDNYHLRRDYGTRHRAAIGASEIGDTIAIVVSEERGTISLSMEGRLYTLDNGDALRTLLHKLLSAAKESTGISGWFKGGRHSRKEKAGGQSDDDEIPVQYENQPLWRRVLRRPENPGAVRVTRKQRVTLTLASVAIGIVVWLYVQVTVNPVDTRTFTVSLGYKGIEDAQDSGFEIQIPVQSIQVSVMGRRNTIASMRTNDVNAYIDFSEITETGLINMPVEIDTGTMLYTRTTMITPSNVTVSVRESD